MEDKTRRIYHLTLAMTEHLFHRLIICRCGGEEGDEFPWKHFHGDGFLWKRFHSRDKNVEDEEGKRKCEPREEFDDVTH